MQRNDDFEIVAQANEEAFLELKQAFKGKGEDDADDDDDDDDETSYEGAEVEEEAASNQSTLSSTYATTLPSGTKTVAGDRKEEKGYVTTELLIPEQDAPMYSQVPAEKSPDQVKPSKPVYVDVL